MCRLLYRSELVLMALMMGFSSRLHDALTNAKMCAEYSNSEYANVSDVVCNQNESYCLTVVKLIEKRIVDKNSSLGSDEEYVDDLPIQADSSILEPPLMEPWSVSNAWDSPFLLDTKSDGERHYLSVGYDNGTEVQYAFLTALRTCWPYKERDCFSRSCLIVPTDLAIASNTTWYVCCCMGEKCNEHTYIVHESGLRRNDSEAYVKFRSKVIRPMARQLHMSEPDMTNEILIAAHRGEHQPGRSKFYALRLIDLLEKQERMRYTNAAVNVSETSSDVLPPVFEGEAPTEEEDTEMRDLMVSVFVAVLVSVLIILALVHFCRKRAALVHAQARQARRRRHFSKEKSMRPAQPELLDRVYAHAYSGSHNQNQLPKFLAKRKDRFLFKRSAFFCEELLSRGRFCCVWRASTQNAVKKVAVKVFERQAHAMWANEVAVYAHLLVYANSKPQLRYAETCSWDELWGVHSAHSSRDLDVRDSFGLLHSVSILKFVGVCLPERDDCQSLGYQLVTEHQSLGSLGDFLQHHLLNWNDTLKVAHGIAAGLSFLHRSDETDSGFGASRVGKAPIAHRDIKSKNVFLRADLHASIGDFGLALILDDEARTQLDEQFNSALLQCGTRVYMSPELLTAVTRMTRESFIATDVYAFALVLYELLSRTAELHCAQTVLNNAFSRPESAIATDSEDESLGRKCQTTCQCNHGHLNCTKTLVYEVSGDSLCEDVHTHTIDSADATLDVARRVACFKRSPCNTEQDCECTPFSCFYRLPYTRETGFANPDLETLKRLVATQNYRPPLVDFVDDVRLAPPTQLCGAGRQFAEAVREYCRMLEHSWDVDADARLSAATICVRLKKLLSECSADSVCRCVLRFVRPRQ